MVDLHGDGSKAVIVTGAPDGNLEEPAKVT